MGPDVIMATLSVVVPLVLGLVLASTRGLGAKGALLASFGGGMAVAGATWAILALRGSFTDGSRFSLEGALVNAFLGAALPEETAKLAVLGFALWAASAGERAASLLSGTLAGVALGLGFSAVENLAYAMQENATSGMVRLVTAVPCHAFLGAVMGHYVAGFRVERRWSLLVKAWLVPFAAHGLYNIPLVLDPRALPGSDSFDDLVLSCIVLAWLGAWTRMLVGRLARDAGAASSLRAPE